MSDTNTNDTGLALEMSGIVKIFSGVKVLDGVDFSVRKGEVHALMGENGAGKSTLMKILAGIYDKNGGSIRVRGRDVDIRQPTDSIGLGIAFVHQHPNLVPMFDVARNIFLGREPTKNGGIDFKTLYAETERILANLGINLSPRRLVRDLSVAGRQELSITAALSLSPGIIVFDEPTASLSFREVDRLFTTIERLTSQGVTVVYISHRMDEILRVSNRITVLRNGKTIGTLEAESATVDAIVSMMIGRELSYEGKEQRTLSNDPLLRIESLTTERLPDPVSLTVNKGEVVGLFGLVGAGRTELARAVFGADTTVSGVVEANGKRMTSMSPGKAVKAGMAFVPEDRHRQGLIMDMSIRENASIANLKKLTRLFVKRRAEWDETLDLARALSIKARSLNTPVSLLSGGNQQKVVLAKWLARKPNIFILDEPTAGIDVHAKGEIYNLVNKLAHDGAGVLFISSEPEEMFRVADRILVMYRKKIVGEFAAGAADMQTLMTLAMGGDRNSESPLSTRRMSVGAGAALGREFDA